MGAPGAAAGSSGSFYKPHYWVACSADLDLLAGVNGTIQRMADGMAETGLHYTVLTYSDGDVEVTCDATIGSNQSAAFTQYYPSVTKGSNYGGCLVSVDYPPIPAGGGTVGVYDFEVDSNGPQAMYKDPDNPLGLNGFIYVFTQNDCNSNVLGDDGKWTQVKLSDVF
jgi:hypothetical protein